MASESLASSSAGSCTTSTQGTLRRPRMAAATRKEAASLLGQVLVAVIGSEQRASKLP